MAANALVVDDVAPGVDRTTGGPPPWLPIVISPVLPLASGNRLTVLGEPSGPARPAPVVPRIPIVMTGVSMLMASTADLEIWPLTKENTPSVTLAKN
jgi:hypothetical protein